MPLRLETNLDEKFDLAELVQPLISHQKTCKAYRMPILQNTLFHGIQLPPIQQRDQNYEYRFIVSSVTSPLPRRMAMTMEVPLEENAEWWRALVMRLVPDQTLMRRSLRRSPNTERQSPAAPAECAPEVPYLPSRIMGQFLLKFLRKGKNLHCPLLQALSPSEETFSVIENEMLHCVGYEQI